MIVALLDPKEVRSFEKMYQVGLCVNRTKRRGNIYTPHPSLTRPFVCIDRDTLLQPGNI